MRRIGAVLFLLLLAFGAAPALASSGKFITGGANAPQCTDIGTQVRCSGKVAGLGGDTFEITVEAQGIASVICENPAGRRAPGQDTSITAAGTSGPQETPTNGQFTFTNISTVAPTVPNVPTCPNAKWTATVVDVTFGDATLSLFEEGVLVDRVIVPVN